MEFSELMKIIRAFLDAILRVLEAMGIKLNKGTETDAQ